MSGAPVAFRSLAPAGSAWHAWVGVLLALCAAGLAAAHYVDVAGHWVTGMNNHVAWGLPHVFAVFLIVCASGALNGASLASVFRVSAYAPLARLSAALAVSLLAGGLAILVLDLGRPDRLVVAMTTYNFSSVFTWNVFLYTGFALLVAGYLWTHMEQRLRGAAHAVGLLAFGWRIALTTGTGCIFGFLVAREAYDAAVLAPLFVAMSLALGTAVFLIVALVLLRDADARTVGQPVDDLLQRMARLLSQFVLLVLYLIAIFHLANGYAAEHDAYEAWLLGAAGGYTTLFWIVQVLFGCLVPVLIVRTPLGSSRGMLGLAAALVLAGGFAQIYLIIVAGQAFPMDLVPGFEVLESSLRDGAVAPYAPSAPELLLGVGGVAFAALLFTLAMRVLALCPAAGPRVPGA